MTEDELANELRSKTILGRLAHQEVMDLLKFLASLGWKRPADLAPVAKTVAPAPVVPAPVVAPVVPAPAPVVAPVVAAPAPVVVAPPAPAPVAAPVVAAPVVAAPVTAAASVPV